MKSIYALLTFILLGAVVAFGQDCKPAESLSFERAKDAVQRITTYHMYTGWDEKALSRSGDMAAVAIVKTVQDSQITSPAIVKEILRILQSAFGCPSRCVRSSADRQPQITMLLLEHLRNSTRGRMRTEIDATKRFVLQQTSNAD